MHWSDNISAIDDSREPIHFQTPPQAPYPGSGEPLTLENLGYNGPRAGHWAVANTVVGSAIDDGCPTVHAGHAQAYEASNHVQRVKRDMVERLAQATLDEHEADKKSVVECTTQRAAEKQEDAEAQAAPSLAKSKGFYIPMTGNYGIRISGKNGKTDVVRPPQIKVSNPQQSSEKIQIRNMEHERKATEKRTPSVKSDKAPSVKSSSNPPDRSMIRIVAKSGEEVFAEMPPLRFKQQSASHSSHRTQSQAKGEQPSKLGRKECDTSQRDANAAKVAQKLRDERIQQTEIENKRAEQAMIAAEAMMSGALPASKTSEAPSLKHGTSVRSAKSSGRSSGLALGGMFGDTSKPPSVASSKTSVQLSNRVTSEVSQVQSARRSASLQQDSQSAIGWQEVDSGIFGTGASHGRKSSHAGWQQEPVAAPAHSSHRSSHRLQQSVEATSHYSLQQSQHQPEQQQPKHTDSRHNSIIMPSSYHQPTIYAGHGWISPHPLSVAPTELQEPPDPAIRIPSQNARSGGERTITFQEWQQLKQNEEVQTTRRNYSRSTTAAGPHSPASSGHRNAEKAESKRSGASQKAYQSPMAESVRSERTFEHQFDGAREVDGQTILRMPWDNQEDW